jgi:hypothetical protein
MAHKRPVWIPARQRPTSTAGVRRHIRCEEKEASNLAARVPVPSQSLTKACWRTEAAVCMSMGGCRHGICGGGCRHGWLSLRLAVATAGCRHVAGMTAVDRVVASGAARRSPLKSMDRGGRTWTRTSPSRQASPFLPTARGDRCCRTKPAPNPHQPHAQLCTHASGLRTSCQLLSPVLPFFAPHGRGLTRLTT